MKLKKAILSVMARDELKAAVARLELEGVNRRSGAEMRARLSRAHRATPQVLLEHLGATKLNAVCELVGVSAGGTKTALVSALLKGEEAPKRRTKRQQEPKREPAGKQGPRPPETVAEDEPARWLRPEEIPMSEQPTVTPAEEREPAGRPFAITRTELVWPGKYDERGNLVEPPRVSLPFQVIEVIEEGRTSREALRQTTLPLFGEKARGPAADGWRNKLIWGDNLLVEASLLQEFTGKIDLIYIDPPFATGQDFSVRTVIGDDAFNVTKEQSAIEEKAYRDTWGKGESSWLSMLAVRLPLMRDLLSENGNFLLHLDYRLQHQGKLLLDDVFGSNAFINEIVWHYNSGAREQYGFGKRHHLIFRYGKSDRSPPFFDDRGQGLNEKVRVPYSPDINIPASKAHYYDPDGKVRDDVWQIPIPGQNDKTERTGYDTQKPERLLDLIVASCSPLNGIVADFFCGSGTTLAVAEKLGRRWIGCDLGRFAVHTTRKRLLGVRVKDPETGEERGCRPFEVLNLGRYERKYWQGITFGNEPRSDEETALGAYVRFLLDLYKAQPVPGVHIHGKKGGALVHVGAVDAPVTISQIEEASAEAQRLGGKELHILGWEFEMGLHDPITQYVRAQHGITVRLLSIPRETMEKRAVETGDVRFFDLAFLEVEVKAEKGGKKDRGVKVALKNFVIPSTDLIPEEVRTKIRKWSDYIDYWAVDWDFRNDTFVNQWQTYRTRKDRALPLETPVHGYDKPGTYQILVKVVDIFGNDTSHLVRHEVK